MPDGAIDEARLWHACPRLDAPARLLLGLPSHQAKWLLGGVLPALVLVGAWSDAWGSPAWWAFLLGGLLVGIVGAFVRPHGRHLGHWASALVTYYTSPRRAVWKPVGRRTLVW